MKVDVAGLVAAAQKLLGLATAAQGLLAETPPLAVDPTSVGAAARLEQAALELWGAACQHAYSMHKAAVHLIMVAAKFGGQEEINKAGLTMLITPSIAADVGTLSTLEPVPPIPPDVRIPLPPPAGAVSGEAFSQQVTAGSAALGVGFSTTATNNGIAADTAAITVREVAAAVPDLWDSPQGTAALAGRLTEHAAAFNEIADRWYALGEQARKHANDYTETVSAVPKPQEFKENEAALRQAQAAQDPVAVSQLLQQRGVLEQRAIAEALRYAGVTETSTSPQGAGTPQAPGAGVPGGGGVTTGSAGAPAAASAAKDPAQLAKAGAAEATQAGQAGDAAGQLAQMIPSVLGAVGGAAGGLAGMAGQVPQGLMQAGQGMAQAATQGLSGLASKTPTDAELTKAAGVPKPEELAKAKGGGGAGGGGGGATHPAGSLGPPVTPSTSHTPPTMPAGAPGPPPSAPT
ncbi:hypothetical protein CQY20_32145, partial [Mycolicibacterium agri]